MLISFSKAGVSDSPLRRNLHSQALNSAFDETEHENHFGANPISFEIGKNIQHSCKLIISNRKILSFSHSLFLWFWAFQGNKQCTCSHDKQSASLYIRQDSIDMLHSITQEHAITAIGCNQKLMHLSPSEWTSVLRRLRRHSRTVQEEYMHAQ